MWNRMNMRFYYFLQGAVRSYCQQIANRFLSDPSPGISHQNKPARLRFYTFGCSAASFSSDSYCRTLIPPAVSLPE